MQVKTRVITKSCPCNIQKFFGLFGIRFFLHIFFLIFSQNIDCGYTLEPPRRGGYNEYTQSMFKIKNKENRYTPVNPRLTI